MQKRNGLRSKPKINAGRGRRTTCRKLRMKEDNRAEGKKEKRKKRGNSCDFLYF